MIACEIDSETILILSDKKRNPIVIIKIKMYTLY